MGTTDRSQCPTEMMMMVKDTNEISQEKKKKEKNLQKKSNQTMYNLWGSQCRSILTAFRVLSGRKRTTQVQTNHKPRKRTKERWLFIREAFVITVTTSIFRIPFMIALFKIAVIHSSWFLHVNHLAFSFRTVISINLI